MIKTTVCVMDTTLNKIKELKIHPRQSSEDVITNLIRFYRNSSTNDKGAGYMLKRNEVNNGDNNDSHGNRL